nr:homeodomain-like protein [Tanacetum cinerariifolium]
MGDVIIGKPFLREVGIKSKWFKGTITLYKDDKSVTYQMVRSHPWFKCHTKEQCNKIPPLLKDKKEYKGNNVIKTLMNVPIFVKTFFVLTDFVVFENMDAYHDEGMGDVIIGKPFLREVGIKSKWFKGTITLYKDDKSVTYQMVRSHPRFKCHTKEQCNKIPPLLNVSDDDKMNGISHPYLSLKRFYKGVLNLGLNYIRDARMEEWLIHGHTSV